MITNILGLIVLILLVLLFGWLTFSALRSRRRALKWAGVVLAGLFTLVFLLVTAFAGRGLYILYAPHSPLAYNVAFASTPESLARGEHIAVALCAGCHSPNGELPLSGGRNLSGDTGLPLGDLYPPNLTPAGPVKDLSDADVWRIFRQGVFPNGQLALMPVTNLQHLSDSDLQSVIAYLRSQPAVAYDTPPANPSLLMAMLVGANLFNLGITPVTGPVSTPAKGATAEYGAYIVSYSDCIDCHGANLDGHPSGPTPPGPNLRVVKGWTQEQFINTLRTGTDPGGHQLTPAMPWKSIGKMDNEELAALYLFLKALPSLAAQ